MTPPPSSPPATCKPNRLPFVPPPFRAKAERQSRRRAIEERARKGFVLTEEERAILAEGEEKDDCILM
ncbi:uncharacterized protein FIBRA_01731 [Fibroporia radiculosa]|uniref:Uncharacterized protein n=1 Tax=Fibroporia radiculosa TaxID=599839 RepID=J4H1D9_9APHY|nr:uncharacterized protein FIBRA_01731 [Fibroporia radiculosa]CCL99709.1 predicted protein [Fibroporia radiculosa]